MMSSAPRVVITGLGLMSPLGCSAGEFWRRLLDCETAVRRWPDLAEAGHRVSSACRIAELVDGPPLRRGSALALAAARQAVQSARIELPENAGIFVGSTLGESYAFECAAEGMNLRLGDYSVRSFAETLRRHFHLGGPMQCFGTACAAGNYALGAALSALRRDSVAVALAGGVEPFSRLAMVGFSRSRAMAAEICRPFDQNRTGMLLGEGAAFFVLERAPDALSRGALPLAEVVSLGLSCDAYHATAPQPDGIGMCKAMQAAIEAAGIEPKDVDWVNAHGSGTRLSDAAEAKALRTLFGGQMPLVSGSKGALGHALGASSALETAICLKGLETQTVPPTFGHDTPDPEAGVACTRQPAPARLRWVMNNAFAFGGINSALLLRRWEP
jgi:3-oxoacyl-[acyl-carrier-protein] synthase II